MELYPFLSFIPLVEIDYAADNGVKFNFSITIGALELFHVV